MKKSSWHIFIGALVFCSCSSEREADRFELLFEMSKTEAVYSIHHQTSSQAFIEEVELNSSSSLCYHPQVAQLQLKSIQNPIQFQVSKYCLPYTRERGRMEILRISEDSLLMEFEYLDSNSLEREIKAELRSRLSRSEYIKIQPSFGWSETSSNLHLSDMERTFSAIKSYANEVCSDWYGNKLRDLSEDDFNDLQMRFRIQPVIDDLTPDPPKRN